MTIDELIEKITSSPGKVEFAEVIATIDKHYDYTPTQFSNGTGDRVVVNEAGANEGSCKIFAFAKLNHLSPPQTLACFGTYYRNDVLKHLEGTDHANIRNFMQSGWAGIKFEGEALQPK